MQDIFTFSIRQDDALGISTINTLKELCRKKGQSFSFVVIEALKDYLTKVEKSND